MPETQNFYASGAGNGFPFCLGSARKVNVSFRDYWTTLSGYNKTHADMDIDVTQEQIDLSLANARRLYWDTYGITGTASGAFDQNDYNSYSHSIANVSVDDQDDRLFGQPIPVPRERVCSGSGPLALKEVEPTLFPNNELTIAMSLGLRKLYNGSTSDEGNFVGYGMQIATLDAEAPNAFCRIRLGYFANDLISGAGIYRDQSVGYVERYGMHFVANCFVESFNAIFFPIAPGQTSPFVITESNTSSTSLSPLSASLTVNSEPGPYAYQSDASAEMTSLDFYTYT